MSLMKSLISGTSSAPPKIIVYGPPGVGKTTFAATAGALLIDCENGAGNVEGLHRTPYLETWPQIDAWLVELSKTDGVPVVAIDTIDWLIQRIIEHVTIDMSANKALTNTLSSAHGGYGRAAQICRNVIYRDVIPKLNAIAARGTAIVLLAHADNEKMTGPEGNTYKMAAPDIDNCARQAFIEWADAILYAKRKQDGTRVAITTETNTILAKNRFGLQPEIELSWPAFVNAAGRKEG